MICPQCQADALKVIDSRDVESEPAVRRRRECEACNYRFTTYERVEASQLWIVKKDGRREPFDREKLSRGIWRACEKRPISQESIDELINTVEQSIRRAGEPEVAVETLGEAVMEHLKGFDEIAYIRFASVYRQFADLGELQKEVVKTLKQAKTQKSPEQKPVKTNS